LVVVLECDAPLDGGACHLLDGASEVAIGRGATRESQREGGRLVLRFPAPSMSAAHARLVHREGAWVLEDLGSRNGTRRNGTPIERATLREGDLLELGRTLFVFHEPVAIVEGAPSDLRLGREVAVPAFATLIPPLAEHFTEVRRIAATTLPMLLLGETGVGKEVLARAVHEASGRRGRFVAVNCGALPRDLVEAQLFGHAKGAFSGALRDHEGFVRASDGGTLFLDEIGDLPLAAQAAFLRVLQEREVMPVGTTRAVSVDLRIIAATHRALEREVEGGAFRSDLYARLAGFVFVAPPLRDRRDDVGVIVSTLLRKVAGERAPDLRLSIDAARALIAHDWPRNVRELEQALAAASALARDGEILLEHLPAAVGRSLTTEESGPASTPLSREDDLLRATLVESLRAHRGNVTQAARALGKAPMQVYRWMRRFGIDPRDFR
jgi:transcriptional regulator with GAF, ATPase, and Fis domain